MAQGLRSQRQYARAEITAQAPVLHRGPPGSELLVLGEAPGGDEVREGRPFVGASGQELGRIMEDAGLDMHRCLLANVCILRPPGNDISAWFRTKTAAKREAPFHGCYPLEPVLKGVAHAQALVKSMANLRVVVPVGNTALWAILGGEVAGRDHRPSGITLWRGSQLMGPFTGPVGQLLPEGCVVIPTMHPAAVLRVWEWRSPVVRDFRLAAQVLEKGIFPEPSWHCQAPPDFRTLDQWLTALTDHLDRGLTLWVGADIETFPLRAKGAHISCIALAWTRTDHAPYDTDPLAAVSVPFFTRSGDHYWSEEEETRILQGLEAILTHPGSRVVWQNAAYDCTWIQHHWGFVPRIDEDTMTLQHAAWPGMAKRLDFLSSLYLPWHRFWKEDKEGGFVPGPSLWRYNARDAMVTLRLVRPLWEALKGQGNEDYYHDSMRLYPPVLDMMWTGVLWDRKTHKRVRDELKSTEALLQAQVDQTVHDAGEETPFNVNSNPKMLKLFYEVLGAPRQTHRKTRNPSLDDTSMHQIMLKRPDLKPLVEAILDLRGVRTLLRTALAAQPEETTKTHLLQTTTYVIGGTETGRFASKKNPFRRGLNLANVSRPRYGVNLREIVVPREGYVLAEADLDRADAQVVAWEADDAELKQMFREGVDIHAENAKVLRVTRQLAKNGVHAVNYGVTAPVLAIELGVTVRQAADFIRRWLDAHPAIPRWHDRVTSDLMTGRSITTPFGWTRYCFERMDNHLVKSALAWVPQTTVAWVTNQGMVRLWTQLPQVRIAMQNHDSLTLEIPEEHLGILAPPVIRAMQVEIPYDDPLTIPVTLKVGHDWHNLEEYTMGGTR